jgi:hypothetical protein
MNFDRYNLYCNCLLWKAVYVIPFFKSSTSLSKYNSSSSEETMITFSSEIFFATSPRYEDIVKMLLDFKCEINLCDKYGRSALHVAATLGHTPVVKLLIANDADTTQINWIGQSALYAACAGGELPLCVHFRMQCAKENENYSHKGEC